MFTRTPRKLLAGEADSLESIAKAEGVKAAYAARLIRTAFLASDLKQARRLAA